MHRIAGRLSSRTLPTALALARLPEVIRGYEEVKLRSVAAYDEARIGLLAAVDDEERTLS